nr:hypothetical protein [Desulfoluna spongiiphila]
MNHSKEFPLRIDLSPPSQGKPILPEGAFDVAEDRFNGAHTPAVPESAFGCVKTLNHNQTHGVGKDGYMPVFDFVPANAFGSKLTDLAIRFLCHVCDSFKTFLVFKVAVFDIEFISGWTDELLLFKVVHNLTGFEILYLFDGFPFGTTPV